MSRPLLHLSSLMALAVALTGCPDKDGGSDTGGDINCDAMAVASVQVTLVDQDGAPITAESTVTYDAGSGEVACEPMPDGVVVCGWEVAGPMHIVAEAEGYGSAEADVVVESDVCHVITAHIEMELEAMAEAH